MEREGEKHQSRSFAPIWGSAYNPGMCPDQESNLRPLALQDDVQPTKLTRSRLTLHLLRHVRRAEGSLSIIANHLPSLFFFFSPGHSALSCIMTSSYFERLKEDFFTSNYSTREKEFLNCRFRGKFTEQWAHLSFLISFFSPNATSFVKPS